MRKSTALEQCKQAAGLRARGLSYLDIGRLMNISPILARDLARRYERDRQRAQLAQGPVNLPQRAILNLVVGKYGSMFGATTDERLMRIADIATAYTWDELLAEEGIGLKTAWVIRLWLQSQGRGLRVSDVEFWPSQPSEKGMPAIQHVQSVDSLNPLRFVRYRRNGYTQAWMHQRRWA